MTLIEQVQQRRAEVTARRDTIVRTAEAAGRDLLASESREFDRITGQLADLDERLAELEEQETRRAAAATVPRPEQTANVRVGYEPRTYSPDPQGPSFLRDVFMGSCRGDALAQQRLGRHAQEEAVEGRDAGTGAFAGLTVPQYLTDLVAPAARAGRPTADVCNQHPLPAEGMSVNISRITTASTVAVQATENLQVSETDMDDTLLTIPVVTIAGQQDVSRQAVERGTGLDQLVVEDLARAYNTKLDASILNDTAAAGTHLGIRSTPGIVAVAYTDATPTVAELWPKLADLVQQIETGVFMGISHFVMHPRRWWHLASQVSATFPFLAQPGVSTVQGGASGGTDYAANPNGRSLMGIPVVLDANIPVTLGGGSEDVILGVTAPELHLWEQPGAPLLIRAEQPLANQLSVRFVCYGYSAFTAGRYPGAHGTIGGTGLAAPTFA